MVLGNSGNEYVLCSDQAIPLKAKLPPGKWTVKQCDVVNLQNQILSISASGDFDFRTPKSKAAITLFSLNDRQNPKAVPVKENIAKFIYNSGNEIQSSEVKNTRPMIKTVSADLEKAVVNEMYNEDLEARGGNPPLTWRSVDLPSGLLLEKGGNLTGKISSLGKIRFTVIVTDADVNSDEKELMVQVAKQK